MPFEDFEKVLLRVREVYNPHRILIILSGGEPLVRSDIVELSRALASVPGIEDIAMTTNGTLLEDKAQALFDAGIKRINISLDTLDAAKYAKITRGGRLSDAINGIKAALEAGMKPVKINSVLIGGFNDDEIEALARLTEYYPVDVRFIELMPIGFAAPYGKDAYISNETVLQKLPELEAVESEKYDMIIINYANSDMVGHTGVLDAAIKAVEALDECVEKVKDAVLDKGGQILLTADHGNSDNMLDADGNIVTSHSLNPVPLVHISSEPAQLKDGGKLSDIAPTMLELMGLEIPKEITGDSLKK